MIMNKKIIALFSSEEEARHGIKEMRERGYQQEISLMAKGKIQKNTALTMGDRDNTDYEQYPFLDKAKESETGRWADYSEENNVMEGSVTGGVIGGIGGLAIGIGALTIPGVGPLIAAGPIAAILSGAVIGGITGALADWGIPQEQSVDYESRIKEGKTLVGMEAREEDVNEAMKNFLSSGAYDIKVY